MKLTVILILLALTANAQSKWCDKDPNHPLCICEKNPGHPNCVALPVVVKSFTVEVGDFPELAWDVVAEKDNEHFTIERSTDGKHWTLIAIVTGRGTTLEPKVYKYADTDNITGKQYYLLKQKDYDGHITVLGARVVYLEYSIVEGFRVKGEIVSVGCYNVLGGSSFAGLHLIIIVTKTGRYTHKIVK